MAPCDIQAGDVFASNGRGRRKVLSLFPNVNPVSVTYQIDWPGTGLNNIKQTRFLREFWFWADVKLTPEQLREESK